MDYGRILIQMPVDELLGKFRRYTGNVSEGFEQKFDSTILNPSVLRSSLEAFSMEPEEAVIKQLGAQGVKNIVSERVSLEDAFIGLTGKY